MRDLELVLRFFALQKYEEISMKFKDHLSDFMDRRNKEYKQRPELEHSDSSLFLRAATNCWQVFGDAAFRRPSGAKSAPLADALMFALSGVEPTKITEDVANKIVVAISKLYTDNEAFQKSISYGTNGRGAIELRLTAAKYLIDQLVG
jgi:hypothetical protein